MGDAPVVEAPSHPVVPFPRGALALTQHHEVALFAVQAKLSLIASPSHPSCSTIAMWTRKASKGCMAGSHAWVGVHMGMKDGNTLACALTQPATQQESSSTTNNAEAPVLKPRGTNVGVG